MEDGRKLWLWLLGVGAACVGGMILVIVLIHRAWERWGAFGTLLFFFALIMLIAWIYDRRQAKKYEDDIAAE
jgi:hypothetical protein